MPKVALITLVLSAVMTLYIPSMNFIVSAGIMFALVQFSINTARQYKLQAHS